MKIEFEVSDHSVGAIRLVMDWFKETQRRECTFSTFAHDVVMQFVQQNIAGALESMERVYQARKEEEKQHPKDDLG